MIGERLHLRNRVILWDRAHGDVVDPGGVIAFGYRAVFFVFPFECMRTATHRVRYPVPTFVAGPAIRKCSVDGELQDVEPAFGGGFPPEGNLSFGKIPFEYQRRALMSSMKPASALRVPACASEVVVDQSASPSRRHGAG